MGELFKIIGDLVEDIRDGIQNGVTDEDIMARLSKPGGVGQRLVAAIRARRNLIDEYIKNG